MKLRAFYLVILMVFGMNMPYAEEFPDVDMNLVRLSEHVWYVRGAAGVATDNEGFISNAGVVITDEGVVVLDALGSPGLARLLLSKIRQLTDKPIVNVVVTHYHADHVYGLQVFKALGAEVIAPQGAEDYIGSPMAEERLEERRFSLSPWVNEDTRLVVPDELVSDEKLLEIGGVRLTLTRIGAAHSDSDMTMLVEPDAILFSGDVLFSGRVPFLGDGNTRLWLDTLRKMEREGIKSMVPGHGAAVGQPDSVLEGTIRYLSFLREKMGAAVDELIPFDEAYAGIDWSEFSQLPAFEAANRRNAYQVYLSLEAEALD